MNIDKIPPGILTKRQIRILRLMASGEELVYDRGRAYVGLERTNGRTILMLQSVMAIKESKGSRRDGCERYELTSLGRDALKTGVP